MALDVIANPAVGGVPGVAAGTPVCRATAGHRPSDGRSSVRPVEHLRRPAASLRQALAYLQTPLLLSAATSTRRSPTPTSPSTAASTASRPRGRTAASASTSAASIARNRWISEPDIAVPDRRRRRPGRRRPCRSAASFDVREVFAELQIPIVSHSFFDELTLGAGYRYSDYKVAGQPLQHRHLQAVGASSPRSATSAPAPATTARSARRTSSNCSRRRRSASAERSIRAPARRPTATAAPSALNTGVTAGPVRQRSPPTRRTSTTRLFGGNPDLSPETADTYTVGVVLQPRFVPGLAVHGRLFRHQGRRT